MRKLDVAPAPNTQIIHQVVDPNLLELPNPRGGASARELLESVNRQGVRAFPSKATGTGFADKRHYVK